MDISRPLEFPTTPDMILEYHRQKPILNNNEEWLVVELNEYECLVDGFEILRIIAKHSKFFEVKKTLLVGLYESLNVLLSVLTCPNWRRQLWALGHMPPRLPTVYLFWSLQSRTMSDIRLQVVSYAEK